MQTGVARHLLKGAFLVNKPAKYIDQERHFRQMLDKTDVSGRNIQFFHEKIFPLPVEGGKNHPLGIGVTGTSRDRPLHLFLMEADLKPRDGRQKCDQREHLLLRHRLKTSSFYCELPNLKLSVDLLRNNSAPRINLSAFIY